HCGDAKPGREWQRLDSSRGRIMPVFTIQAPDGRKIRIEAGDEATAMRGAQEWAASNPAEPAPSGPPEGSRPGTPEYAAWAAQQAQAGNGRDLPQVSDPRFTETQSDILDPFVQGVTFGFGDELRGAV